MRREAMKTLCGAVESGGEKLVLNSDLYYVGRVIACGEDSLRVEAFGHHFDWKAARCREVAGGTPRLGPPTSHIH